MRKLPQSVLFACSRNSLRSPMAEAILKHRLGDRIFVDSVGVDPDPDGPDPFAVTVLGEWGIDLGAHQAKSFLDIDVGAFDLIVSLCEDAHEKASSLSQWNASQLLLWPMPDASMTEGSRETRLDAYRGLRMALTTRIDTHFRVTP